MGRLFVWLATGGGAWALGSNWNDVTDGIDPSLVPPGAQDSVMVMGPSGAQVQTITGGGLAGAAMFAGNTMLSGAYAFGTLSVGSPAAGGLLQLGAGASLKAGGAIVAAGSLLAGHGATLSVTGTLSLGTAGMAGASLAATGDSAAAVLALLLTDSTDSIYVDPTSIIEVGSAGGAVAGALTIDAGATLSGQGNANAYGTVVNGGIIEAAGGTLTLGALSGTGTLLIDAGATLTLNGACGAGQTIAFAGAGATLALKQEAFAPAGTLTGFAAGEAIDVLGSQISSASFTASGSAGGTLSLFYGGQVAARLYLAGSYAGSVFLTAGDGAGGTLVTVAASGGGGGGSPSPGTTTPDQYAWIAAGSGAWNSAANWQDVTTGASPAAIAPGVHDLVTIAAAQNAFSVITGPANAAALNALGEVGLRGTYTLGTLTVGQVSGSNFTPGTLDVLAGSTVAAATAAIADGAISVAGSLAMLSVAGTLILGGSTTLGVGLPTAALTVTAGGTVRAGNLFLGDGSGASLTTDPTAAVEIGGALGSAAGAVTIDAGAMLSGNGQVNPFGTIVDSGTVLASGGTLTLGAVSGAGTLAVGAGATLELLAPTATPILLTGSATAGASVLAIANALDAPTGGVGGWAVGDAIDLESSTLTMAAYNPQVFGNYLLLNYGTTLVARIPILGTLAGVHFVLSPDGAEGSLITLVANSGGGGGGGQTGTDMLAWTNPVSGSWSRAANWTDVTAGGVARQPPGAQTPVQLAGPTGVSFQSIVGAGGCASLAVTGNSVLSGAFTTGQLTIGQAAGAAPAVDGVLEIAGSTSLAASQGTLASGELLAQGTGAVLTVAGTLSLGGSGVEPDALLSAGGHAIVQLGGLSLTGGINVAATVDAVSVLEVGNAGGAAQGVLTVDAGALASGSGTLNAYGPVIDNGEIDAQGGTLLVGATSGAGTLGIGTEAVLALGGTDACAIAFLGGGATLVLPGLSQLPTAAITGFAPGDSILCGSPIDAVSFQPGAGVGTLTLSIAGQVAGYLLLAGNFAGESFAVQPDGSGAAIGLTQLPSGPPPGTLGPDAYRWTGAAGSGAWAAAGNWVDTTQGTGPASVAPGQNDNVTIAGGASSVLTVTGPADAASLSLSGTVSLVGTYAIGKLTVTSGLLALASGADVSAAGGQIGGALAVGGGALTVGGTLALGAGGVLAVSGGSAVRLGAAMLATGSALAADPTASIEIGGALGARAGAIVIDPGATLQGAGAVGLTGQVIDQGTIVASGGTLVLGAISGGGTLLVGPQANLVLAGPVDPGLEADFTGGGTLTLQAAAGRPTIADFGTGDAILLPDAGVTQALYAITGPGIGVLTLSNGGQVLDQLTLLGSQAGRLFTAAASPGGGTILTTTPDPNAGPQGDPPMTTPDFATGQITRGDLLTDIAAAFPYVSQDDVGALIGNQGIYLDYSTDGLAPAQTVFGGVGQIPGVNVEVVAPLTGVTGGSVGPGGAIAMAAGYSAVFLQGNENLGLTDGTLGHALLVGNFGNDTIAALGDGDTLVGATGANTTFFAAIQGGHGGNGLPVDVYVHGGGNDLIATNYDNAAVTTSGGRSTVSLGPAQNSVASYGQDTVVCSGIGGSDTVHSLTTGRVGDVVFGPQQGILNFFGGNAPSTVVGGGGDVIFQGGAGSGSLLWAADSNVNYTGGAGSALIVAGSGFDSIAGGAGPITVFGGTGSGVFSGSAGSAFVVGNGDTTVRASTGNSVWLEGAAPVSVAGAAGVDVYGGQSIGNNIFQAFAGNETLWGGAGNDQFLAGTGNDIFVSGGGEDVFSFTNGVAMGIDTIVGFIPGESTIALHGYGTHLPTLAVAYGDTVINLQGGAQIIVENATNLTAANFTLT